MIREVLLLRFLGIGIVSDAFYAAFKFPNNLRKVFAEGALSSVLIPSFVRIKKKKGKKGIIQLITLSFIIIEVFIIFLALFFYWKAAVIIKLFSPGFSPEQIEKGGQFLKILSSFILFISSGSVFAAALQADSHFFIPAISPSILNVIYIGSLLTCMVYNLSVNIFCLSMIFGSIIFLIVNFIAYLKYNFTLKMPDKESWKEFTRGFVRAF